MTMSDLWVSVSYKKLGCRRPHDVSYHWIFR